MALRDPSKDTSFANFLADLDAFPGSVGGAVPLAAIPDVSVGANSIPEGSFGLGNIPPEGSLGAFPEGSRGQGQGLNFSGDLGRPFSFQDFSGAPPPPPPPTPPLPFQGQVQVRAVSPDQARLAVEAAAAAAAAAGPAPAQARPVRPLAAAAAGPLPAIPLAVAPVPAIVLPARGGRGRGRGGARGDRDAAREAAIAIGIAQRNASVVPPPCGPPSRLPFLVPRPILQRATVKEAGTLNSSEYGDFSITLGDDRFDVKSTGGGYLVGLSPFTIEGRITSPRVIDELWAILFNEGKVDEKSRPGTAILDGIFTAELMARIRIENFFIREEFLAPDRNGVYFEGPSEFLFREGIPRCKLIWREERKPESVVITIYRKGHVTLEAKAFTQVDPIARPPSNLEFIDRVTRALQSVCAVIQACPDNLLPPLLFE